MKLEINLADREEIAAAVPLMQLILAGTAAQVSPAAQSVKDFEQRTQVSEGEQFYAPPPKDLTEFSSPCMPNPPVLTPLDPSAVFGLPHQSPAMQNLAANLLDAGKAASVGYATTVGTFAEVPAAPLAPSIPPAPGPFITVPPPPAAVAPITTTHGPASSGAAVASIELDKAGLPWDSRIHSSSKAKLANGNWKVARGKAPEYVKEVEAELRSQASTVIVPGAPGHTHTTMPVFPMPPIEAGQVITGHPAGPLVVAATSAPVSPAPGADPATFEQLMPRITAAVTSGVMPPTAIGAACAAQGLVSVVALQQSPQFVPLVWAVLKQQYPALS